jgi:outer membrane protein OmpA-like peptidoglycan-associated protein
MNASSFKTMPLRSALAGAALIALVGGCSTTAEPNATLDRAHAGYRSLQADPQSAQTVPTEMAQADEALRTADAAWTKREEKAAVEHLAYLAQQRVAIARETAATRTSEKVAATAKAGADANKARADLAAARQNTQDKTVELAVTKAVAQQDRARATDLEVQLKELNAKQTDRGDIVSLGDVLFESNRAEMTGSGRRDMGRLVAFMKEHPKRTALIEGFTDSQGGAAANVDLSQRRAMAVRDALVVQGVFADRLSTHGYGDAHPVASNATAAGRQMNRRVEIVLSRDDTMARGR